MESTLRYYNYFCNWCNDELQNRNPYRSSGEATINRIPQTQIPPSGEKVNNRIHQTQTPPSKEETSYRIYQTPPVLQIFYDIFSLSTLLCVLKVIAIVIVTLILTHTIGLLYFLMKTFLIYYTHLCFSLHIQFLKHTLDSFSFVSFIVKVVISFLHSKMSLLKFSLRRSYLI